MPVLDFYSALFDGLDRLGPGTDSDTARLVDGLRLDHDRVLLELGAGHGVSAVMAARRSGCRVIATDRSHDCARVIAARASESGVPDRVCACVMDLRRPALRVPVHAVLCEGAAYFAGLASFLRAGLDLLRADGLLAFTHLAATGAPGGDDVHRFWQAELTEPLMPLEDVLQLVEDEGYTVCDSWLFGDEAWRAYLGPVARRLATLERRPEWAEAIAGMVAEIRMQSDRGGTAFVTYAGVVARPR